MLCRIMAVLLCALYMCMVYGLYVPDWEYQAVKMSFSSNQSSLQNVSSHDYNCRYFLIEVVHLFAILSFTCFLAYSLLYHALVLEVDSRSTCLDMFCAATSLLLSYMLVN